MTKRQESSDVVYTVYYLADPSFPEIPRYVGVAKDTDERLRDHIGDTTFSRKRFWIAWLKTQHRSPIIVTIRLFYVLDDAYEYEKECINGLRIFFDLLNTDSIVSKIQKKSHHQILTEIKFSLLKALIGRGVEIKKHQLLSLLPSGLFKYSNENIIVGVKKLRKKEIYLKKVHKQKKLPRINQTEFSKTG